MIFSSLPSTGVDVSSLITAGLALMGTVVVTAVGGFIAFQVVKKGLDWVSCAFGAEPKKYFMDETGRVVYGRETAAQAELNRVRALRASELQERERNEF